MVRLRGWVIRYVYIHRPTGIYKTTFAGLSTVIKVIFFTEKYFGHHVKLKCKY